MKGRNRSRGAIVLESTLLFPFLIILLLGCFGWIIVSMQRVEGYIAADESADRIVHGWGQSTSDPGTGMFFVGEQDPLYRRMTSEGLALWFGSGGTMGAIRRPLPDTVGKQDGLVARKLAQGAYRWPQGYTGEAELRVQGLVNVVTVHVRHPQMGMRDVMTAQSSEVIADPAEWLRHVRLAQYVVQNGQWGPLITKIKQTIQRFLPLSGNALGKTGGQSFSNHAEAVRSMRSWVRGTEARRPTQPVGQWRLIDALDAHAIAHQVYIGPKTTHREVLDQLEKDAELIRTQVVRGVVWHFVRRTGETSLGPSPQLVTKLRQAGVLYVVHE